MVCRAVRKGMELWEEGASISDRRGRTIRTQVRLHLEAYLGTEGRPLGLGRRPSVSIKKCKQNAFKGP